MPERVWGSPLSEFGELAQAAERARSGVSEFAQELSEFAQELSEFAQG